MSPDHSHESTQIIVVSKITRYHDEWMTAFGSVRYEAQPRMGRRQGSAQEKRNNAKNSP